MAWPVQFAGALAVALTGTIFLNFLFGSCWLFIDMAEDITKDLAAFSADVKSTEKRAELVERRRRRRRRQLVERFCDIIQLYSDAKQ